MLVRIWISFNIGKRRILAYLLTIIVEELEISVEQGRVVITLNIILSVDATYCNFASTPKISNSYEDGNSLTGVAQWVVGPPRMSLLVARTEGGMDRRSCSWTTTCPRTREALVEDAKCAINKHGNNTKYNETLNIIFSADVTYCNFTNTPKICCSYEDGNSPTGVAHSVVSPPSMSLLVARRDGSKVVFFNHHLSHGLVRLWWKMPNGQSTNRVTTLNIIKH